MSDSILALPKFGKPKVAGIYFRFLCMTGKNKGMAYYFNGVRAVIGRGSESDLKLLDFGVSKTHAEIKRIGDEIYITDLDSHNGVIVNDLKVGQAKLNENDRLVVGQVVFKFNLIKVEDADVDGDIATIDYQSVPKPGGGGGSLSEEDLASQKAKKKKKIILILVLLMGFLFIDSEDSKQKKKPEKTKNSSVNRKITDEFTNMIIKKEREQNKKLKEKLQNLFHRGLREAREGNYFRAINEFNLALILSPNNARATYYLKKTQQELDSLVEQYFLLARKDIEATKYTKSINSYCSILRLLQNFSGDERYQVAVENIHEMEKRLGLEEGETYCIEE